MTYLEVEIKAPGKSTWNDTHNMTSSIRNPQVCLRHIVDGRSLQVVRVKTQRHTLSVNNIGWSPPWTSCRRTCPLILFLAPDIKINDFPKLL